MNDPLDAVGSDELSRLARVAERLLAGRPVLSPGHRPRRQRPGQGNEFLDFRPYLPGDDIRDIDWRASVRSREPQVRRRIEETRSDWFVCLDASASMGADATVWPLARQLAAAWCYLLMHLGHRVGLLVFSDRLLARLPAGRGHAHHARLRQQLARAYVDSTGRGSRPRVCAGALPARSQAVIVTDCLQPDGMRADFETLRARLGEIHILGIRGAPVDEPPPQTVTLVDAETGERRTIDSVAEGALAARRRHEELTGSLAAWCRRAGLVFTPCSGDQRWSQVLSGHLAKLAPASA